MSRGPAIERQLVRTLIASAAHAGCTATLIHEQAMPWSTATFTGARHRLIATAESAALGDWLAGLPEAELPLTGWFVASCAAMAAGDRATIELLVIEA